MNGSRLTLVPAMPSIIRHYRFVGDEGDAMICLAAMMARGYFAAPNRRRGDVARATRLILLNYASLVKRVIGEQACHRVKIMAKPVRYLAMQLKQRTRISGNKCPIVQQELAVTGDACLSADGRHRVDDMLGISTSNAWFAGISSLNETEKERS